MPAGISPNQVARQQTRDQMALLLKENGDAFIYDSDDAADFTFICSKHYVLVSDDDDQAALATYFQDRVSGQTSATPTSLLLKGAGNSQPPPVRAGLAWRYELPGRTLPVPGGRDLLVTLGEVDGWFKPGFAVPDHVVHVATVGGGKICPATEPEETGLTTTVPPRNSDRTAGAGVKVVVIDTGWYADAATVHPWLAGVRGDPEFVPIPQPVANNPYPTLSTYAGHGTFVAGVIQSQAPACEIHVIPFDINIATIVRRRGGGALMESELVALLDEALLHEPDLINVSAGCTTRGGVAAMALQQWYDTIHDQHPNLVIVAAAGNDSQTEQFWPASFDWAKGVGSVDHNGKISSFSNFGPSVDVFALGRNLVNAYPIGTYTCRETPDKGDKRRFTNMLARWSGTSFAAPLVTGMIAARMTRPAAPLTAPNAIADLATTAHRRRMTQRGWIPVLP